MDIKLKTEININIEELIEEVRQEGDIFRFTKDVIEELGILRVLEGARELAIDLANEAGSDANAFRETRPDDAAHYRRQQEDWQRCTALLGSFVQEFRRDFPIKAEAHDGENEELVR